MPEPKARCEYRLPSDVYLRVEREAREAGVTRSAYVEEQLRAFWARLESDRDAREFYEALHECYGEAPPARRRWWQRRNG